MLPDGALCSLLDTPIEWAYRGEGNCNLVIGLPQSRQILRMRKTDKPQSLLGWFMVLLADLVQWYSGRGYAEELRDLDFYGRVMRPLIGAAYTSEARMVALSRRQLQMVKADVAQRRPGYRQHKTIQLGRAALFSDFAFLPPRFDHLQFAGDTFAVELKPKQGWRPLKERLQPHCLYCMQQLLKLEKGHIKSPTGYCPEELFSGDEGRMKAALKHLLAVPQNNLKIFRNGQLCFDDRHRSTKVLQDVFGSPADLQELAEEFCGLLQRCLVKDLAGEEAACPNCANSLPPGSVLGRILAAQQLDQEGTHSTYKKLTKGGVWQEFGFVDKLLSALDQQETTCLRCALMEIAKQSQDELVFAPYLVAAIAKDCSLMVTLRRMRHYTSDNATRGRTLHTRFGPFLVNVGVFDLYPKPLSTIYKHQRRNWDVIRAHQRQP